MKSFIACPVQTAVDTIGGKWKILIIYHLLDGVKRFGEMKKLIPGITQKMLTQQLRELEADGIVHRRVYAQVPPKVEYSITELGKKLEKIFAMLCEWSGEFQSRKG